MLVNHPCPPSCMRLNSKRWGAPGPPIPVSWLSLCRRCKWFFLMGLISAHCRVEDCNKLLLEDCKVHCRGVLKKMYFFKPMVQSRTWWMRFTSFLGSVGRVVGSANHWEIEFSKSLVVCNSFWPITQAAREENIWSMSSWEWPLSDVWRVATLTRPAETSPLRRRHTELFLSSRDELSPQKCTQTCGM